MSIRVLIVDDHLVFRQALACLLKSDANVVGHVGTGGEALIAVRELNPDVVLLDVRMPKMDGWAVLRRLRVEQVPVKVLIVTSFDDAESRARAVEYGADGLISKFGPREILIAAIQSVVAGQEAWPAQNFIQSGDDATRIA